MISKHLEDIILKQLKDTPTEGQLQLIQKIADYILSPSDDETFILTGYAGTGKTTVIAAIINALDVFKFKSELLAPTGRAAKVLSSFSGRQAFTIHKKIYRQKSSKDGMGKFVLGKNLASDTIFFVDEASMIGNMASEASMFGSGDLLADLLEFVYSGRRCKLILIGDPGQLPPVGLNISPALDKMKLEMHGFRTHQRMLKQVVRQSQLSGILFNASHIRELIEKEKKDIPKLNVASFDDIINLNGSELIDELIQCYENYGMEETMVVCRSNKRANIFNKGIRNSVLFYDEQINTGDFLMVVKNNYYWLKNEQEDQEADFIANGDIVQLVRIKKYEERYGFHFVDVIIRLPDKDDEELEVKLLLETLEQETPSLPAEDNKRLFFSVYEDYEHLKPKKAAYDAVKNDPFFNALQVKFAYAVTCHKAQGGQWKAVFVDPGYFTKEMMSIEYLRWLYTALTRASERLYLVNFSKEFFE